MKKIFVMVIMAMMLPLSIVAMEFSDVQKDFWAYPDIKELTGLRVISGYPDNSFKPQNQITRAEFLKLISIISDKKEEIQDIGFLDNYELKNHWAYLAIEICAKKGLIDAYDNPLIFDLTEVDKPILRAEMALLIARNFTEVPSEEKLDFNDIDEYGLDERIEDAIKITHQKKIISGYPDGSFKPMGKSTRAEAAAMLHRYIKVSRLNKAYIINNSLAQEKTLKQQKQAQENKKYEEDLTYLNEKERWYQGGTPKDGDVKVEHGKKFLFINAYGWINWKKASVGGEEKSKGTEEGLSGILIGY